MTDTIFNLCIEYSIDELESPTGTLNIIDMIEQDDTFLDLQAEHITINDAEYIQVNSIRYKVLS